MNLPEKWDSSLYLAVNALEQALYFPREGYKGSASSSTCEFSGARTAKNWALAEIPSQTQLVLLLELPRNSVSPKFPNISPEALVFESNLLHKAALSCSAELFQGLCLVFVLGSYFVMMESQSSACDPEEFEEGLEVMTDKLCHRAGGRQGVLCKVRCILY